MIEAASAPHIRIIDEVLPERDLERLMAWVETVQYRGVHEGRWRSVWRLGDGEPYRGPTWTISGGGSTGDSLPEPLEALGDKLRELVVPDGSRCSLSLTPWLYPSGTALGLHRDDGRFEGSYVFYLTREWDVRWGGLLNCVTETDAAEPPPRAVLDPSEERSSVAASGRGLWISPAWNRLVVLGPSVRHFISRVDPAAGDRVRISIGGFLHKPQGRS